MKLSKKDKSLLLLVSAALVVLWIIFSIFSNLFFNLTFHVSDATKVTSNDKREWFNVTRPLTNSDLKDRVVLLHFWTQSCVSCIEALPEIKKLEEEFGSKITVIGVYSAKFENEKSHSAIRNAILRYDISHPVVSDNDLAIWNDFKINAWPSFVLLNAHGNEVATYSGVDSLKDLVQDVKKTVKKFRYQINRDVLPLLPEKYNNIGNVLSFPSKMEYAAKFSYRQRQLPVIFISNSAQNNIVVTSLTGDIILKIGSGKNALIDGSFDVASFSSPSGMLFDGVNKLYVADSGNHSIRVIDFKEEVVKTIIGSGTKGDVLKDDGDLEAKNFSLSSPSDLEFFPTKNKIVISNSGTNQILSYDLKNEVIAVLAGNGDEGMVDGKYPENSLAQTADMSAFGHKLYFVDSLSSSLRVLDEKGEVKTLIGSDERFGHENGNIEKALMQHPLGLAVDDTGIYIADSFNNAIRKYDFSGKQLRDLVGSKAGDSLGSKTQFDAPEGIISVLDRFYIADSNNNRIVVLDRGKLTSELFSVMPPLKLPKEGFLQYLPNLQKSEPALVKADAEIILKIDINAGWKINEEGPSFINLLELTGEDQANLIASSDWHAVQTKEVKLPKLDKAKNYLLQGTIYYCEDKKNALCYIKSYEQKISAQDDKVVQIDLKLGY